MNLQNRNLSPIDQGDDIRHLQGELSPLGLVIAPIERDQVGFRPSAAAAVRDFQKTGTVDSQTAVEINAAAGALQLPFIAASSDI